MQRRLSGTLFRAFVACLACLPCAGCSSAPSVASSDFPSSALMSVRSASGALRTEVRSSPQPPQIGDGAWSYTITNAATGKPATGLSLEVVPWMPAMGHGTSTTPSVTEMGEGVYIVDDVVLFMPGQWDLRTSIRTGAASDPLMSGAQEDSLVVSVDLP